MGGKHYILGADYNYYPRLSCAPAAPLIQGLASLSLSLSLSLSRSLSVGPGPLRTPQHSGGSAVRSHIKMLCIRFLYSSLASWTALSQSSAWRAETSRRAVSFACQWLVPWAWPPLRPAASRAAAWRRASSRSRCSLPHPHPPLRQRGGAACTSLTRSRVQLPVPAAARDHGHDRAVALS